MRFKKYLIEARYIPLERKLNSLRSKFAKAAQKVYDQWEQDEKGYSCELGTGGICQDIAGAFCEVMGRRGIDCTTVSAQIGEQHVWAVAFQCPDIRDISDLRRMPDYDRSACEAYIVDLHPSYYESGGGYTWKKIPNVKIRPRDITIEQERFEEQFDESEWF